jgi:predicted Zn-dependent peptidase
MDQVVRKEIMPFAHLTYVKTQKFKTGCLSVNLITQLDKKTAAKNALLPKVLRRGTARHPDMEHLSAALDELYGARIEPIVRKIGENHCIGFYADFIDDDFVPRGENILEKVTALLGEMLLLPNTHNGILLREYVESERRNLIDEIAAEINDKRSYSIKRLLEIMCDGEAYGVGRLGEQSTAAAITPQALTKYYRNLLSSARIEIFYCGAAPLKRVESALLEAFSTLPRGKCADEVVTDVVLTAGNPPKVVEEAMDVGQGKLAIGFRLGACMKAPNYAAISVFNAIYGGAVTSKLFLNVREKLSLCYFASSAVQKLKGVMLVSSGIEFDKYEEAKNEILSQLDAVRNGEIEDWELTSAKRAVITSIQTALDRPAGIEGLYFENAISGIGCTPDELAALSETVTKDDVQKIAQSVVLDTIYFLKGTGGTEHEA